MVADSDAGSYFQFIARPEVGDWLFNTVLQPLLNPVSGQRAEVIAMAGIASIVTVALILLVHSGIRRFKKRSRWRIKHSKKALKTLRNITEPQRQFGYLRSRLVDPFVFEEMILTALEESGHKIRRNERYTGDGGIDGQAWIDGQHYLIQAKKYRHHIKTAHVNELAAICAKQKVKGLFIHTGQTGAKAREAATHHRNTITIISGEKMLDLLNSQPFQIQRTTRPFNSKGQNPKSSSPSSKTIKNHKTNNSNQRR